MSMTFQVGNLLRIDPADPELLDEKSAVALAVRESNRDDAKVFAVWTGQEHGSELVALAYQGDVFRK